MADEQPSLGDAVRAAREAAGMTVEQVHAATRIRTEIVADLEAGRTASSGGGVYARGHLRAIAQATGSDPVPLLAAHDRATGTAAPLVPAVAPVPAAGSLRSSLALPTASAPERRTPRWGIGVAAAVAVLSVLVVIGSRGADQGRTDALDGAPSPSPSSPAAAAPQPPVGPGAVASVPAPTGASLRVRILGGPSWVRIRTGSEVLVEGVLDDGYAKDFTDPGGLDVVVGDKRYATLLCGGQEVPAGGEGKVLRFTCAPSGLVPA